MAQNFAAMWKECTKPHVLLHSIAGLGLGLLLAGVSSGLAANGIVLGLILIIASIASHWMIKT